MKVPAITLRSLNQKDKVIKPYTKKEVERLLAVCEKDHQSNARFLGSPNKATVLVLIDSGVRLSESTGMKMADISYSNGRLTLLGFDLRFWKS